MLGHLHFHLGLIEHFVCGGINMENNFDVKNFTPEQLNAVLACKTTDELIALAKENGFELTEEKAKGYLSEIAEMEVSLSDEEMKNIAGGGCGGYCIYNQW